MVSCVLFRRRLRAFGVASVVAALVAAVFSGCRPSGNPTVKPTVNTTAFWNEDVEILRNKDITHVSLSSAGFSDTITRDDPRFELVRKLLAVGEHSHHLAKFPLHGDDDAAPSHEMDVYFSSQEGDTSVYWLAHYEGAEVGYLWTKKYDGRRLPKKLNQQMGKVWKEIREAKLKGGQSSSGESSGDTIHNY